MQSPAAAARQQQQGGQQRAQGHGRAAPAGQGGTAGHAPAEAPRGVLTLQVWPGPDCRGALYLDAGEGSGHRAGELRRLGVRIQDDLAERHPGSTVGLHAYPKRYGLPVSEPR